MITTLCIKDEIPKNSFRRFMYRFKKDVITQKRPFVHGVTINEITYIQYKEKIAWKRIEEEVGEEKNLLCSRKVSLPKELGFNRYFGNSLMSKMAGNSAVEVLKTLDADPNSISVCLVDFKGEHSDLVMPVLEYTNNLKVITNNINFYMEMSADVMKEYGASMMVHKKLSNIKDCVLVIAPERIRANLPISENAVVFTGLKPMCPVPGIIYDAYKIDLPEEVKAVIPEDLTEEYFAQALFEKGGMASLGTAVPQFFYCANEFATREDVCKILESRLASAADAE